MWLTKKLQCNDIKFTLVVGAFLTLINALFIQRSWAIIAPARLHDILFCCVRAAGAVLRLRLSLSLLNIPFIRKPLLIVLTVGRAAQRTLCIPWRG